MVSKKKYPTRIFTEPIPPLPYHPALRYSLFACSDVLVFTYLELTYPSQIDPEDPQNRLLDGPYYVRMEQLRSTFGFDNRTIQVSLRRLSSIFKDEEEMWSAKRAGRQFLVPHHIRVSQVKPYSIVGFLGYTHDSTFAFFRNFPRIAQIYRHAAMLPLDLQPPLPIINTEGIRETSDSVLTAKGLARILARAASSEGVDRRTTRYVRARAAIANGVAGPEILKVTRAADYYRWTPERKAAQSRFMKEWWAKRKGSMDNMPDVEGTP